MNLIYARTQRTGQAVQFIPHGFWAQLNRSSSPACRPRSAPVPCSTPSPAPPLAAALPQFVSFAALNTK